LDEFLMGPRFGRLLVVGMICVSPFAHAEDDDEFLKEGETPDEEEEGEEGEEALPAVVPIGPPVAPTAAPQEERGWEDEPSPGRPAKRGMPTVPAPSWGPVVGMQVGMRSPPGVVEAGPVLSLAGGLRTPFGGETWGEFWRFGLSVGFGLNRAAVNLDSASLPSAVQVAVAGRRVSGEVWSEVRATPRAWPASAALLLGVGGARTVLHQTVSGAGLPAEPAVDVESRPLARASGVLGIPVGSGQVRVEAGAVALDWRSELTGETRAGGLEITGGYRHEF
jgi:hypothetical protein